MTQIENPKSWLNDLRRRAESLVEKPYVDEEEVAKLFSPQDVPRLLHSLHVHQIELEMQNEELRQSQIKLEELKDKYVDLYDFAPVGYVTLNDKGLILEANLTVVRLLGAERKNFTKMYFSHFVSQEFGDAFYFHLQKVFETQSKQTCEIKLARKDGSHFYAQLESVAVQDENGQFNRCRTIVSDITDRKRAEELALQAARFRSVAELSSGVAHHFNNLLQIIVASTSLSIIRLESGGLTEIKTTLEKMLEVAKTGSGMVRRLQTFANIRADITDEEAATLNIAAAARNAAEISKPLWKAEPEKRGTRVNLQFALEDGCLVKGIENELFEVLINLIRNAAEALPQGGDIEIKAHIQGKDVVVEVRDTGIGIAEGDLSRIFQPFWSSKGMAIGTGMGLAVTQGLVKRHGGTISVQSKVGKGTTFTVRLPLAEEPIRKTEKPAMRPADGKLTILLIDDDLNIATLLEMMFVEVGHRVFKALSGEEGLAIFDRKHVDLVLCDLGMPGMNGWDVGKAIRAICRHKGTTKPPFILLTGWGGQEQEMEKIAESGTDEVVAKPIEPAALIATVQEIAARSSIRSHAT